VDDPYFDINDDGLTNIQDLVILAGSQDQANMTTTNPPTPRSNLTSQSVSNMTTAYSSANINLVSLNDYEAILRIEGVDEPVYAVGVRLALPASAAVTEVVGNTVLSDGFVRWHQKGQQLYIVIAPAEGQAITHDTDFAVIHGTMLKELLLEAESSIIGRENNDFLPLILK